MNRLHSTRGRWLLMLAVLLLVGLFAAVPARAAETRGGNQVVIGRNEIITDDLYVAGSSVTIDGIVKGDLVAFGSQITINGEVSP